MSNIEYDKSRRIARNAGSSGNPSTHSLPTCPSNTYRPAASQELTLSSRCQPLQTRRPHLRHLHHLLPPAPPSCSPARHYSQRPSPPVPPLCPPLDCRYCEQTKTRYSTPSRLRHLECPPAAPSVCVCVWCVCVWCVCVCVCVPAAIASVFVLFFDYVFVLLIKYLYF